MNNQKTTSKSASRPQTQSLTPEQQKEQFIRAYVQKKSSLAEGILYNLIQSCGRDLCYDLENNKTNDNHLKIVGMADQMATEFMKVVYKQELNLQEEAE